MRVCSMHTWIGASAGLLLLGVACGGELEVGEAEHALAAISDCGFGCVDPADVVSAAFTGGGSAVDTSTSAAQPGALANAKQSACDAAKATITSPNCPDPANCLGTSTMVCTYGPEDCRVSGTFGGDPSAWVAACKLSSESDAWKKAHCSKRTGPGGKPAYVLCTIDATAKASTKCTPKKKACEAHREATLRLSGEMTETEEIR